MFLSANSSGVDSEFLIETAPPPVGEKRALGYSRRMDVLVTGATGFVGREVVRQVASAGHRVRFLARDPRHASARELEHAWGAQPVGGNLLDPASLEVAVQGINAVIHLVGIISEIGTNTFDNAHRVATENVVEAARRRGITRMLHMSALGTRDRAVSRYHQTKWAAETAVRRSGLDWTIFRPSLIYGPGDGFVNLYARLSAWSPVIPVMGRKDALFQPVAVKVVAEGFVQAMSRPATSGQTFDVCGPERLSLEQIIDTILQVTNRRRLKVKIPAGLARMQAALLEWVFPKVLRRASPLNQDQLIMLEEGNTGDAAAFEQTFRIPQTRFAPGIAAYLQR
jgi:NADH dehydrogenase